MRKAASPSAPPALIAVGGWIATGKSTLAKAVAAELGAELLVADRTRGEMLRAWDESDGYEAALRHSFSASAPDEIYETMIQRSEPLLRAGRGVVLDGCFASRQQRAWASAVAERCGARFHLLLCLAPRKVIEARLDERTRLAGLPARSWSELLDALLARWQPPTEIDTGALSLIPTDQTPERSLELATEALAMAGLSERADADREALPSAGSSAP